MPYSWNILVNSRLQYLAGCGLLLTFNCMKMWLNVNLKEIQYGNFRTNISKVQTLYQRGTNDICFEKGCTCINIFFRQDFTAEVFTFKSFTNNKNSFVTFVVLEQRPIYVYCMIYKKMANVSNNYQKFCIMIYELHCTNWLISLLIAANAVLYRSL